MVTLSYARRRRSICQVLVSAALYAWSVLAFPNQFQATTTTSARGFKLPLTFRSDRRFKHGAVLEETTSSGTETEAASYEGPIRKFLASARRDSPSSLLEQFHIHGWRWHKKSLSRDAGRLHRLALKTNAKTPETLKDASDYVIGFNMMGLHKIEKNLFFPWMRDKLTIGLSNRLELSAAFSCAIDALETDQRTVARLGEKIAEQVSLACDEKLSDHQRSTAIHEMADHSAQLQGILQRMMLLEDTFLVPALGAIVPAREQKSFNNKVLRKLGLLDSRLHLVGMYEAVWDDEDDGERELFQKAIPSISRQMIPRWKRKLYQPKTYMME